METELVLKWVESRELPDGGIEGWTGLGLPYPEVTGYLLPTLMRCGSYKLCGRLAYWLISIQNDDGSWNGLNGAHCTFDTAAIVEGLRAVSIPNAKQPIEKAEEFLSANRLSPGVYRINTNVNETTLYTARINGIMGEPITPWTNFSPYNRSHYIAYALEGLYLAGLLDVVKDKLKKVESLILPSGLIAFDSDENWKPRNPSDDICATIQFAILYRKTGNIAIADKLISAVEPYIQSDGGIWQSTSDHRCISWAAKFYLDYCYVGDF